MPAGRDIGSTNDGASRMSWWNRLRYPNVQAPDDDDPGDDRTIEDIRADIRYSNDKERTIGLVAAPIAAIVGIAISSASLDYARAHHESLTVYDELTYVLLGLAVLILIASLLRRRLFQGITLALFGVAVFQLHYSYVGFAAPFVLAGAWYLIRAYRLQQELKNAEVQTGPKRARNGPSNGARPRPSKRYTPPT